MIKDSRIFHKFNQNLLLIVGLILVVFVVGYVLINKQPKNTSVLKDSNELLIEDTATTTKENVEVPTPDEGQVVDVREIGVTDHIWGSSSAPVKMIVYDDFECPFCGNYYDTLEQVKKDYAGKVQIAFRHFPLTNIHPYALQAAEASECASVQGKFWEMYDKLFADNKAGRLNEVSMKQDAKDISVDQVKFAECLFKETYKDKVQSEMLEAKSYNVNGTPTTFINGQIIVGAYPYEDFTGSDGAKTQGIKSIIEKALSK